jgi:hypothetical protein
VPLFISGSDSSAYSRAPELRWTGIWLVAGALAVGVVCGVEEIWRSVGHQPSVVDGPALWSITRGRLGRSPQQIALLGSSRMQLGFSMDTFHRHFRGRPIAMLAINGTNPVAALRDLAKDNSFRGTVLCEITEFGFLSHTWEEQHPYVHFFREAWPHQLFEPQLRAWLQSRWVVLNPSVSLKRFSIELVRHRRLPQPLYVVTHLDRSRSANYRLVDLASHREKTASQRRQLSPVLHSDWLRDVQHVAQLVHSIQARGGKVVFVKFPVTDELWEIDQDQFPKVAYWDSIAPLTGARTLHFMDIPGIQHMEVPDLSHLDAQDADDFTAALLAELEMGGSLSEPTDRSE